ncbi:hypothetical protein GCM10009844_20260 [Nocardioides koreensis]|uniref:NadR/Ttd14 AAA domain-containing protein n=1 Tax=Nocardioides koreensis TaxID=433651 RepID=A0ABN2ZPH5_9ACTN
MPVSCRCNEVHHRRRVVLTGGPGAGKTALLELVRHSVCPHVHPLAESAGVVFGGGFPRSEEPVARKAAQRAIFHVQRELEVIGDTHNAALVLCDRGTVDGLAYWPGPPAEFWSALGTRREDELARYDAVIHLRTPTARLGYNRTNPLRTESARVAALIDDRLLEAWEGHPRRVVISSESTFLHKATHALEALREELPTCCASGGLPFPGSP